MAGIVDNWIQPAAMAIPKAGYFKLEQGRYGPIFPRTPANYGFTIVAKIKPGTQELIRSYGGQSKRLSIKIRTGSQF